LSTAAAAAAAVCGCVLGRQLVAFYNVFRTSDHIAERRRPPHKIHVVALARIVVVAARRLRRRRRLTSARRRDRPSAAQCRRLEADSIT